jgi:serine/threonine protein kinase
MEFYERDLEGEVMRRAEDLVSLALNGVYFDCFKDYFPEAEIWYILEAVMNVEKHMLERMRVHGDIRTSAIFISEEGKLSPNTYFTILTRILGVAKFIDTNLTGYRQNAYVKTMLGMSKCPVAPEQLTSLGKKESNPKHDSQATESWSIGIVLLTMATLSSEEVIYNWRDYTIDKRGFDHLINQVLQRYSPLFNDLVKKCLDFNPSNRPKLTDILGYLARRKSEK